MNKSLLLLLLILPLFTACSPYWYREHEGHIVSDSNFNRLTISYQRAPEKRRTRCEIDGNGKVLLIEGNATSVTDPFDTSEEATYGDVQKYSCILPQATITQHLQGLVNAGLLKIEENGEDAPAFPRVLVSGRVNGIKVEKFTFSEDLITEIQILLMDYKLRGGGI